MMSRPDVSNARGAHDPASVLKRCLATVSALFFSACATEVVTTAQAKPVPPERVLLKDATTPFAGAGGIVVKRDAGFYGSGCSHHVLLDGRRVAVLEQGEKVTLYVTEGEHVVGAVLGGGLCPGTMLETRVSARAGTSTGVRLGVGSAGELLVAPTAF
jgi:hypothetical protein